MNERIKELAVKAGWIREAGEPDAGCLNLKQFAELIVLGCIDIANKNRTAVEVDRNTHLAADAIKQHFGVTE